MSGERDALLYKITLIEQAIQIGMTVLENMDQLPFFRRVLAGKTR